MRFQPRTNDDDDDADQLDADAGPAALGADPAAAAHLDSVVAICENRTYEIGIACLRLSDLSLELSQFCDDQAYSKTLSVLERHQPRQLLFPPQAEDSLLERVAVDAFPLSTVSHVPRKKWNELRGLEKVRHYSHRAELAALGTGLGSKYLALSAIAALVEAVEHSERTSFVKGTLKIRMVSVDGTMLLDAATVANLE